MMYCTLQTAVQEVYDVLYTADCSTGSIWCIVHCRLQYRKYVMYCTLQTVLQEVFGVLYTADCSTGSTWCSVHCRLQYRKFLENEEVYSIYKFLYIFLQILNQI